MTDSRRFAAWLPRARTPWVIVMLLLLVASRLPLLANGYGTDNDSWRNIVAALHMHEAGRYIPSRVPGFPFFEGLLFLLAPGGWVATNLAAIVAGLAAAMVFARLLTQLEVRNPLWPWLAFAFGTPMMVTASQTMDYAFGIAFFLGTYLAVLQRRYLIAGVLLGLATACRPTYGFINVAVLALLLVRRENWKAYAAFAAGFIPVMVVLFVPVVIAPEAQGLGGRFAKHAATHVTPATLPGCIRSSSVFLLGKFGTVMVATAMVVAALTSAFRRSRRSSHANGGPGLQPVPKDVLAFEISTFFVIAGFFLMIPGAPTYLFPLLPLVLMILARVLPRSLLVAVVVAMVVEPLVSVQLDEKGVVKGQLFQEVSRRQEDLAETRGMLARNSDSPTVYVIGRFRIHRLLVLAPELERTDAGWAPFVWPGVALKSRDRHVAFAATLDPADRAHLTDQGWTVVDLK